MKEIKFAKGYTVTEDGKIISYKYKEKRVLKQYIKDKGYHLVSISCDGKKMTRQVHRVVAEAFIPNPENKPQINHIDGNPSNNTVNNLEWVTSKENIIHAFEVLRRKPTGTKRIKLIDYDMIFESIADCARYLISKGKTSTNHRSVGVGISKVLTGSNKSYLNLKFEYV